MVPALLVCRGGRRQRDGLGAPLHQSRAVKARAPSARSGRWRQHGRVAVTLGRQDDIPTWIDTCRRARGEGWAPKHVASGRCFFLLSRAVVARAPTSGIGRWDGAQQDGSVNLTSRAAEQRALLQREADDGDTDATEWSCEKLRTRFIISAE